MTVLAVYSNKGGVGKTATAVNLAYLSAQSGRPTLICDLDPQSATTFYFRVTPKLKGKARGLRKAGKAIDRSIKGTNYPDLDLLPGDMTHRHLSITFDQLKQPQHRLTKILKPLKSNYDLVILDCPPTLDLLAENIFQAADYLLVPVVPTILAVRAFHQLRHFLKEEGYKRAKVYAFFSMVEMTNPIHRDQGLMAYRELPRILRSPIPYLPEIEAMGLQREPVIASDPASAAAQAYQTLWVEIQQRFLSD